ncbi:hypothetical protein STENM36S_00939 [Streptomyces tendae]
MLAAVGDGLGTCSAGTARIARSTGSPIAPTDAYAGTPSIACGPGPSALFTAYVRPVNPASRTLRSTARPTPPGARPVPTTATEPGEEQALHGARLGAVLTGALHGERLRGGLQIQGEVDRAVLEGPLLLVAGVGDLDHLAVGGQHLGREPPDPALAGDRRDVFEQRGGDPPALVGVLDQEGDLGLVGGGGEAGRPWALIRS